MSSKQDLMAKAEQPMIVSWDKPSLSQSIKKGFSKPQIFFGDFFSGAVLGFINVVQMLPIAALVFTGTLSVFIPDLLGVLLIGGFLGAFVSALLGDYKAILSEPRMVHMPIYVAMSIGVSSVMEGSDSSAIAITIITVIVLSSFSVGLGLYMFGRLKLGKIARFVPLPVTAGILASMGVLIILSAVEFASAPNVEIVNFASLFSTTNLFHLAPALFFGILLSYFSEKTGNWTIPILFLILGTAAFYAVCFLFDIDIATAQKVGWLSSSEETSSVAMNFSLFSYSNFSSIDVSAIYSQSFIILSFVFLTLIMFVLELSAIDLTFNTELNTNHELMVHGKANLLSGIMGGASAIPSTADTLLFSQLGASTFIAIISYCLFFSGLLIFGVEYLFFVPNFIFSGFIMIAGIPLVKRWFFGQYNTLPKSEFIMISCIILSVVFLGIIEGFLIGALLAVCLFVYNYSKLDAVKIMLNRSEIVSVVDRSLAEQKLLDQAPEQLQIFKLQGFLFFGSAYNALSTIRKRLTEQADDTVKYVILDFQHVNSLDTSAANTFLKLFNLGHSQEIVYLFSTCDEVVENQLRDAIDSLNIHEEKFHFMKNLDEAVGWCDDDFLSKVDLCDEAEIQSYKQWMKAVMGSPAKIKNVAKYFDQVVLVEQEVLFEQGDQGDSLYFIESGQIDIILKYRHGSHKIRSMKSGSILGEMTLLNNADRTASAIALKDTKLQRLSVKNFAKMKKNYPQETLLLVSHITQTLSERLVRANHSISALSK